MSNFKDYNRGFLKQGSENTFLYELALRRGQLRGWYPNEWTLKDYTRHLFGGVDFTKRSKGILQS